MKYRSKHQGVCDSSSPSLHSCHFQVFLTPVPTHVVVFRQARLSCVQFPGSLRDGLDEACILAAFIIACARRNLLSFVRCFPKSRTIIVAYAPLLVPSGSQDLHPRSFAKSQAHGWRWNGIEYGACHHPCTALAEMAMGYGCNEMSRNWEQIFHILVNII